MKRLGLLAALALLLGLCLLATAGPALAGVGPLGPQWGGHEVIAKMYLLEIEEDIVLQVVADDPRVSGMMVVAIEQQWFDPDGTGHQSGTFAISNDAGKWRCSYWECVYDFHTNNLASICLDCTAVGSGAYKGLVFSSAHHQVGGSPFILKGWILPAK